MTEPNGKSAVWQGGTVWLTGLPNAGKTTIALAARCQPRVAEKEEIHCMFESAVLVACRGRFATDRSFHTMFERLTDAALAAPGMGGITR